MKISDRKLNLLKARSEKLLEPEEVRRIRKKLHLSQEELGILIGGGLRAFRKYESGELLPSLAVSSALILLDHDPVALSVLKMHLYSPPVKTGDPAQSNRFDHHCLFDRASICIPAC